MNDIYWIVTVEYDHDYSDTRTYTKCEDENKKLDLLWQICRENSNEIDELYNNYENNYEKLKKYIYDTEKYYYSMGRRGEFFCVFIIKSDNKIVDKTNIEELLKIGILNLMKI